MVKNNESIKNVETPTSENVAKERLLRPSYLKGKISVSIRQYFENNYFLTKICNHRWLHDEIVPALINIHYNNQHTIIYL